MEHGDVGQARACANSRAVGEIGAWLADNIGYALNREASAKLCGQVAAIVL